MNRMRNIQDLHAGISRRDWNATEQAANALRDEYELVTRILAGTDIGSLPHDRTLPDMARDRMATASPAPHGNARTGIKTMSMECSECEHDLRGGHADDCPRNRPDDIRKAAWDCWIKTQGVSRPEHKLDIIAAAILAERERCAKKADEQKDEWRNALTSGGTRNVDYANGRSHGAEVIASAIRDEA